MAVEHSLQTIRSIIVSNLLNGSMGLLVEQLDEMIGENSLEVLEELHAILAKPGNLNLLIQLIIKNPDLFERMCKESYYHENGFHKIVLLSGRNFKLRLHHFGSGAKIPMENIHDHRWPFVSSILSGRLKMDLFEVTNSEVNAEKLFHFIYDSNKQSGSYSTGLQGLSYVHKVETRNYVAGDCYVMLPHELHRIKNLQGEESITLILTGKPQSRLCNLYAKREILEQEKITIPYSGKRLQHMLNQILESVTLKKIKQLCISQLKE